MRNPREPVVAKSSAQETLHRLIRNGKHGNALYVAAACNDQNMIETILNMDKHYTTESLPCGKNDTIDALWYGNAVVAAAVSDFAQCIEMILQHTHSNITSEWSGMAFRTAALHDSKECIQALISHAKTGKLDISESDYGSALVIAASNNHPLTIMTLLTDLPTDTITDAQYAEALGSACSAGHTDAASLLLDASLKYCQSTESYSKALHICCSKDRTACAGLLLSRLQFSTDCLKTAISEAASNESPDTLMLLLDRVRPIAGAAWLNETKRHVLWQACVCGHSRIVQSLLSEGLLPLDLEDYYRGCIRMAVATLSPDMVKSMLDKQADTTVRGTWRDEAVGEAASHGRHELLRLLLAEGGSANSLINGCSAINIAAEYMYKECVDLLIQYEADVNTTQGRFNKIPLHWAAENGQTELVESLLKKGSNARSLDEFHQTPLHYAAEKGYTEIVRILIPMTDVSIVDTKERTALICAQNGYHEEAIQLLREL